MKTYRKKGLFWLTLWNTAHHDWESTAVGAYEASPSHHLSSLEIKNRKWDQTAQTLSPPTQWHLSSSQAQPHKSSIIFPNSTINCRQRVLIHGPMGDILIQTTTYSRLFRMDMQCWRFMEWEIMWDPSLGRQEKRLRSDIQSFKYFRSLSSKLKFYFCFSVLHRGRKSRVGHTKSHLLSSVSTQVPFASSHTFVRTTTHPCQFKGSLFKLLTGKESTGNVGAFSRESPKQSRVQ